MSWGRVDDKLHSHPKIKKIAKRTDALGAWVRMLSWTSDYGTDGHLPTEVALDFATQGVLDRLVEVRMLDVAEDGYKLHNFGVYNPGPASVGTKRADLSEKRREAGKRGASSRWGAGTDGNGDGKPDGKRDGKLPSDVDGKPMATDSPTRGRALGDPDPIPIPKTNTPSVREARVGEVLPRLDPAWLGTRAKKILAEVEAQARHLFPSLDREVVAGAVFAMTGMVDNYPGAETATLAALIAEAVGSTESHATKARFADDEQRLVAFKRAWGWELKRAAERARKEREDRRSSALAPPSSEEPQILLGPRLGP